jgi:tetratricopeptide (TPR) repeat protein
VNASIPEKTAEPFHVSWEYTRKDFGDWANLQFPGLATWFQGKFATGVTPPKREIALDTTGETHVTVKLTLPDGYTVTVPKDVKRTKSFAEYTATYRLSGRELEMDHSLHYKIRELPFDQFEDYIGFVNSVSDDAAQMIQLAASPAWFNVPALDDSGAAALVQQAKQKLMARDLTGARQLLDKAKARNDSERGLWLEYGMIDGITNRTQAIADFKKELELHPEDSFAYQGLATLYGKQGQWSDAEQAMQAWGKADPADPRPRAQLGGLQLTQKRYKEAETSLQEAITLSTEPDQLKVQLGEAQLKAGDTDAGKKTLHALMDTSDDATLLNGAAYELADSGVDLPASEAASRKAIQTLETQAAATTVANAKNEDFANVTMLAANWDTLGWIYFKENKLPEAEAYVRSARLLLLSDPETGEHLGNIYEAEGKKEEALTTYRLTVKSMGHPGLPQNYADMKTEMEARVAALTKAGVHEKPGPRVQQGGDELAALRTYTIPSPLEGQYASADFLLLLGDNHAEDVRWLKGDEELRKATPGLLAATYRAPLPRGSKARVLRRGILACTTGSTTCLLVLLSPTDAPMD